MNYLEKACEEIDASVFSSDMLFDDARRAMLKNYLGRWTRAIAEHEHSEQVQPAAAAAVSKEELTDLIAAGLGDTYHCTRVWSAWSVGTMSQDDFEPVDASDTPAEIADAIIAAVNAKAVQS